MSKAETVIDLSGMTPGRLMSKPWTVESERSEEKRVDLTFAGMLGKLCETNVLGRWSGQMNIESNNHMIEAARLAVQMIRGERKRLLGKSDENITAHFAGAFAFQNMGQPLDLFSDKGPSYDGLRFGLRVADMAYGLAGEDSLWGKYHRLPIVGGEPSPRIRYLGEATAILLNELVNPTMRVGTSSRSEESSKRLLLNKTFAVANGPGVQFDALVVPKKLVGKDEHVKADDIFLGPVLGNYSVWEMKCLFRAREGDKDNISPSTYKWYVKEIRQRLGNLAMWYLENHKQFNFPEYVTLFVLRGFAPPVMRNIAFRSQTLLEWAESLEAQQLERNTEGQRKAGLLIAELTRQGYIWDTWERCVALALQNEMAMEENSHRDLKQMSF